MVRPSLDNKENRGPAAGGPSGSGALLGGKMDKELLRQVKHRTLDPDQCPPPWLKNCFLYSRALQLAVRHLGGVDVSLDAVHDLLKLPAHLYEDSVLEAKKACDVGFLQREANKLSFSVPPQEAEEHEDVSPAEDASTTIDPAVEAAGGPEVNFYIYGPPPTPILHYNPPKHMTYALILRQGIYDLSVVYQADWIDIEEIYVFMEHNVMSLPKLYRPAALNAMNRAAEKGLFFRHVESPTLFRVNDDADLEEYYSNRGRHSGYRFCPTYRPIIARLRADSVIGGGMVFPARARSSVSAAASSSAPASTAASPAASLDMDGNATMSRRGSANLGLYAATAAVPRAARRQSDPPHSSLATTRDYAISTAAVRRARGSLAGAAVKSGGTRTRKPSTALVAKQQQQPPVADARRRTTRKSCPPAPRAAEHGYRSRPYQQHSDSSHHRRRVFDGLSAAAAAAAGGYHHDDDDDYVEGAAGGYHDARHGYVHHTRRRSRMHATDSGGGSVGVYGDDAGCGDHDDDDEPATSPLRGWRRHRRHARYYFYDDADVYGLLTASRASAELEYDDGAAAPVDDAVEEVHEDARGAGCALFGPGDQYVIFLEDSPTPPRVSSPSEQSSGGLGEGFDWFPEGYAPWGGQGGLEAIGAAV